MRRLSIQAILPIILVLVVVLPGCDRMSPDTLVARADQALVNRDYRAAMLDLKTVLQENPRHVRARWLLAEVHTALGDGVSAEKELRRAEGLGVGVDAVTPALAKALMLQRDYPRLLELQVSSSLPPRARAETLAWRAWALIETDALDDAQNVIDEALNARADVTDVRYVRARLLFEQDNKQEAEVIVRTIVEQFPDYAAAWSLLGDIHHGRQEFPQALDAFMQAIKHRHVNWEDRTKAVLVKASLGKMDEAAADAAFLRQNASEFHMGHYLAGVLYHREGKNDQAEEALELALELSPEHFQTIYALALVHTAQGNENRARALAAQAHLREPNYIPARELHAYWLVRDNNGEEVERLIRPIVETQPDNARAKDLLAASLLLQDRTAEAAQLFNQISSQRDDEFNVQLRAGTGLLLAGAVEEAKTILQRAVDLAPDDVTANARLVASLVNTNESQEGLRIAKALVERKPDDPAARNLVASALLAVGKRDEALASYRQVLSIDPGNQEASSRLAMAMLADEDPQQALKYASDGLEKNPSDLSLLLVKAEAAGLTGDRTLRENTLASTVELHPQEPGPRALLSRIYLDDNEPEKAFALLSNVSASNHAGILVTRAELFFQLNRLADARRDLEALAILSPDSLELHWQLARIHEALGDRGRLEAVLSRILTLAPDEPAAKMAKTRLAISKGEIDEARGLLSDESLSDFDETSLLVTKIALERQAGRHAEAAKYSGQLYEIEPSKRHLYSWTRAEMRAGNPKRAISLLEQWVEEHPSDVSMLTELADVYQSQGMIDHAVERLRHIYKLEPENLYVLNNLAWFLRKHSPTEAEMFGKRAYQVAPTQSSVIDTYAVVLAEAKDFSGALRVLDEGVDVADEKDTLRLRRAIVLRDKGDNDSAIAQLEVLLDGSAPTEIKDEARRLLAEMQK